MNEDNLPAELPYDNSLPALLPPMPNPPISQNPPLEEVQAVDSQQFHHAFNAVGLAFTQARSAEALCKCSLVLVHLIEKRRKLLLLPTEAPSQKSKGDIVWPVD